jgi:hypothetical protein
VRFLRAALLAVLACHHEPAEPPPHLEPGEVQPLPPASGTPVGYLVDAAGDLKLSDDQLAKLKQIDSELATQLDEIETEMRGHEAPPSGSGGGQPMGRRGRRGGMMGGGMGGGGMGGGTSNGGGTSGGGHRRGGSGSGSASMSPQRSAAIGQLTQERTGDVQAALAKAMEVLDIVQRVQARKLLDDRGIDVDAGRAVETGSSDGDGQPLDESPARQP